MPETIATAIPTEVRRMEKAHMETCWTLVQDAANGDMHARNQFAGIYLPVIRAYLGARWASGPMVQEIDDAIQETFIECFRDNGALSRVDPNRSVRFRTWLFGVVRNVALRFEERRMKAARRIDASTEPLDIESDEARVSSAFDRAWAIALLQRAAHRQEIEAQSDEAALRRVELLKLRFAEGLPIRDIAERWGIDAAVLHHEYAKARKEFTRALTTEVAFQCPGATAAEIERECASLLELIG